MAKPSKFSGLLNCKCPRCLEGDVYMGSAFSKSYKEMYKHCPKCGLKYEYEIGFFWGAMYIGYALNIALSVTLGVATYVLFNNPDTWVYLTIIISSILLTSRFNFRYGRMVLLYIFAPKYEPLEEILKKEKQQSKLSSEKLN